MKLIEGMKKIKQLQVKVDDLKKKIQQYCADLSHETHPYGDVAAVNRQVQEWLQSASDSIKEIERLRVAIQRTNLATMVKIELGGNAIEKPIAAWIHRRKDLAKGDFAIWQQLSDRGLREGIAKTTTNTEIPVTIRRYFDPRQRDEKMALYRDEPMTIDAALEIVNALTDLME